MYLVVCFVTHGERVTKCTKGAEKRNINMVTPVGFKLTRAEHIEKKILEEEKTNEVMKIEKKNNAQFRSEVF